MKRKSWLFAHLYMIVLLYKTLSALKVLLKKTAKWEPVSVHQHKQQQKRVKGELRFSHGRTVNYYSQNQSRVKISEVEFNLTKMHRKYTEKEHVQNKKIIHAF